MNKRAPYKTALRQLLDRWRTHTTFDREDHKELIEQIFKIGEDSTR